MPALLPDLEVEVLEIVPTKLTLKSLERQADHAVRARINGEETIAHLEFQLRHSSDIPARVMVYNGLLRCLGHLQRRPRPVRSMVVYLMHERKRSVSRGIRRSRTDPQVSIEYDVFCVWERPLTLEDVRRRPVLAPIAALTPGIGKNLLQSFRRSKAMQESATYRLVLEEGKAEGRAKAKLETLRDKLLKLTRHRLGRVPRGLPGKLTTMDADALDRLFDRALETEDPKALRALLTALPRRS